MKEPSKSRREVHATSHNPPTAFPLESPGMNIDCGLFMIETLIIMSVLLFIKHVSYIIKFRKLEVNFFRVFQIKVQNNHKRDMVTHSRYYYSYHCICC